MSSSKRIMKLLRRGKTCEESSNDEMSFINDDDRKEVDCESIKIKSNLPSSPSKVQDFDCIEPAINTKYSTDLRKESFISIDKIMDSSTSENSGYQSHQREIYCDPLKSMSHLSDFDLGPSVLRHISLIISPTHGQHEGRRIHRISLAQKRIRQSIQQQDFSCFDESCRSNINIEFALPFDENRQDDTSVSDRVVKLEGHVRKIHELAAKHWRAKEVDASINIYKHLAHSHVEYYGQIHPLVGVTFHNLGVLFVWKEDYVKAEKYFDHSLRCRRSALSEYGDKDESNLTHDELQKYNSCLMDVQGSLIELALVQYGLSHFASSLSLLRESLQLACKVHGYNHPVVAKILNIIGCAHFEESNFIAAQSTFKEALDILRGRMGSSCTYKAVGKGLLNLAVTLGNMSMCYLERKDFNEAIALLEETLMVQESVLGDKNNLITNTKSKLYHIFKLRDAKESQGNQFDQHLTVNSELKNRSMIKNHNKTFSEVKILTPPLPTALVFGKMLPYKQQRLEQVALVDKFDSILLGPLQTELTARQRVQNMIVTGSFRKVSHKSRLSFMGDDSREEQGEGKRLDNATWEVQEVSLVSKRTVSGNITVGLRNLNRPKSATNTNKENEIDEFFLEEENHKEIVKCLTNGDINEALNIFDRVLQKQKEKYGNSHHSVGSCWHDIGIIYMFSQKYNEALPAFKQAIKIRSKALGGDHEEVSMSLVQAGISLYALSEFDNALIFLCEALRIFRKNVGYMDPTVCQILNNIGAIHYEYGALLSALKAFEEALEIHRCWANENPKDKVAIVGVASTLANVGFIHVKRGEYVDAILALEESLASYRKILPPTDPKVQVTLDNLAYSLAVVNFQGESIGAEDMVDAIKEMLRN